MRLEILIALITGFLIFNAYKDNKFIKMFYSYKKYYTMIFYAFLGIGIYLILKKNPSRAREMLLCSNAMIKYLPINKNTMDYLSPIIDLTSQNNMSFMDGFNSNNNFNNKPYYNNNSSFCNPINVNTKIKNVTTKRSVSETKKKYVAARQQWKCGHCSNQLDHTYEIDHKLRLEYGGTNDASNLIALCRNCHGIKTASENM